MVIRVYTTKICPNCKKVEEFLAAEGEAYEEVDITTVEALTELRMNGVFTLVTPIVQIGSTFLTSNELFDGDELRKGRIKEVIKPLQGKPLQGFRGQRGRAPLCGVVGQSPTSERDRHEKRL